MLAAVLDARHQLAHYDGISIEEQSVVCVYQFPDEVRIGEVWQPTPELLVRVCHQGRHDNGEEKRGQWAPLADSETLVPFSGRYTEVGHHKSPGTVN